jgi:mono/diheme cytochrome c family protein
MPCCCEECQLIRPRILVIVAGALAVLAAACGNGGDSSVDVASGDIATVVEEGAVLYTTYCAVCHGANLEGHPDWRTPNADGTYNPPPQDVTGHTWHHGDSTLVQLISEGSPFRESVMPAFGDTLTDEQILAILEFFRSHWGEQERAFQQQATERDIAASS